LPCSDSDQVAASSNSAIFAAFSRPLVIKVVKIPEVERVLPRDKET